MSGLKIRRIHLRGYQQFADTVLDFTNPATGEVADRVCFIGRNGTGKSTILRLLDYLLANLATTKLDGHVTVVVESAGLRLFKLVNGRARSIWVDVTGDPDREALLEDRDQTHALPPESAALPNGQRADLHVFQRVDVPQNQGPSVDDVPGTSLSDALRFKRGMPERHEISDAGLSEMWRLLVFLVQQREVDRQAFELRTENLERTKRALIEEFEEANPSVLNGLAGLWNRILEPAGLEFDVANAKLPIQLTDNLHAYIRHKESGQRIAYSALSTGIRNFLFRTGHLFLLYFNRKVERGFVLIDEPEDSLFPDFLFELTAVWEEILKGSSTQLFVATHSPIVAAQFEPWQRIVLEWDGHGHVTAKHGRAPKGDDPNDVLRQDFDLPELMGPAGVDAWRRYLDLRDRVDAGGADRGANIEEMADLARRYGFAGDES